MNTAVRIISWLIVVTIASATLPVAIYADTDDTEIQISGQPDRLILQFGLQWAGAGFELRTNDGVYPAPVIVDSTGILKMDLGGSKAHTLSSPASDATEADPALSTELQSQLPSSTTITDSNGNVDNSGEIKPDIPMIGIPIQFLFMFIAGMIIATVGVVELLYSKRKKKVYDDDDDDNV